MKWPLSAFFFTVIEKEGRGCSGAFKEIMLNEILGIGS